MGGDKNRQNDGTLTWRINGYCFVIEAPYCGYDISILKGIGSSPIGRLSPIAQLVER